MREPTNEVEVERDVKVTVSDGTVLLADIYHPVGVDDAATILERTPYGGPASAPGWAGSWRPGATAMCSRRAGARMGRAGATATSPRRRMAGRPPTG